jgi:hypothetical protein
MKRRDCLALALAGPALPAAALAAAAAAPSLLNDAINKAGRQRMLSQRLAKSWLALGLGVEPALAAHTFAASMALFEHQLAELKAVAPQAQIAELYARLDAAWAGYKAVLTDGVPSFGAAAAVLDHAGRVLRLAHEGTGLFEALSPRPAGRWVNVCGRQRMLSQRLAALHLGASWGVEVAAVQGEIAKARAEFAAAQAQLEAAPEATPQIREQLKLADLQWDFFDAALRVLHPGTPDLTAMSHVFTTSERILEVMDGVTGQFAKLS